MQITGMQKLKLQKYRNTNNRNPEIKIKEIQSYEVQKLKLQKYRNTSEKFSHNS